MIIGVPREIKNREYRVALTPAGAASLVKAGHQVRVETKAGEGCGFSDGEYEQAGATIVGRAEEAWRADLVVKVKEPLPEEYAYFRRDMLLFTYLHLAAQPELTRKLLEARVTAIAYETVQLPNGALPLLAPMSEIAGRMSVQIGAQFLEKAYGGKGILLGGVPGTPKGKVVIIGGGIVGSNAAQMALGLNADVTLLDINVDRLRQLDVLFQGRLKTLVSNEYNIAESVRSADLLIGAVLIPGAKAPKLVTEDMVKTMEKGSVIVDVAVDQGGSIATVDRVTTHDEPVYVKHGVLHYAVPNIPGAVARTATLALTNMTVPYILELAIKGFEGAVAGNPALAKGVNTHDGHVTHGVVAETLGLAYHPRFS